MNSGHRASNNSQELYPEDEMLLSLNETIDCMDEQQVTDEINFFKNFNPRMPGKVGEEYPEKCLEKEKLLYTSCKPHSVASSPAKLDSMDLPPLKFLAPRASSTL